MFLDIGKLVYYILPWEPPEQKDQSQIHVGRIIDYYRDCYVLYPKKVVDRKWCCATYKEAEQMLDWMLEKR